MTTVRKIYVDGPFGQIHARMTPPVDGAAALICLHATAYSSQSFLPLMQAMGARRQVIAIDAPGYGESDAPDGPITMADYGAATLAAVEQLTTGAVTLLGYHTGCYVAAEMAIERPDLVDRLVMIGVPYFQALDFDHWRERLAARHSLTETLDQFSERWSYFITDRPESIDLKRGFANFVDELKAWPNGWWAHDAMFAYDSDVRLPLVSQPVLILNPQGHLAVPSIAAGRLLRASRVRDLADLSGAVLEGAPDRICEEIETWLAGHMSHAEAP